MAKLPAKSTHQPQSKRTSLGGTSGKGIAKPVIRKRRESSVNATDLDDDIDDKKKREPKVPAELKLIDYPSDDSDFNPTEKNYVPTRSQEPNMRMTQVMGQMNNRNRRGAFPETTMAPPRERRLRQDFYGVVPNAYQSYHPRTTRQRSSTGSNDASLGLEEDAPLNKKRRVTDETITPAAVAEAPIAKPHRKVVLAGFTGYPSITSNKESSNTISDTQDSPVPSLGKASIAATARLVDSELGHKKGGGGDDKKETKKKVQH